jgi:hypothetical protein
LTEGGSAARAEARARAVRQGFMLWI